MHSGINSNRFKINTPPIKGGFSSVFKAWDTQQQCWVAYKNVECPPQQAKENVDRIISMGNCLHENLLANHEVFYTNNGYTIISDWIEGSTLESIVESNFFSLKEFRYFIDNALCAINALHHINWIHLDIQPQNFIYSTQHRRYILIDFDSAHSLPCEVSQTHQGSIYFMSPERFGKGALDFTTDLYSLGVSCYFALTQKYPFDGDLKAQIIYSHLTHQHKPIEHYRQDIPAPLIEWIYCLFSRHPKDRFQTALEALETLRQL
jgi:serine/threonine-protein kinase